MARDRDGTWTEVTDPVIMAKVLNSGETFYRIYARNPDVKALKDIFDSRVKSLRLPSSRPSTWIRGSNQERKRRMTTRGLSGATTMLA